MRMKECSETRNVSRHSVKTKIRADGLKSSAFCTRIINNKLLKLSQYTVEINRFIVYNYKCAVFADIAADNTLRRKEM